MVSPALDLRPVDGLHLVIRSGAARGTSFFARNGARIGRHPLNEVCVREPGVEGHHAVLERIGADWQVRDVSGKGIHQSGRQVTVAHVRPGDRIMLGGVELELLDHPPEPEPRHTETITAPLPLQRGAGFVHPSLGNEALEAILALQARMAEESNADNMVTALADWLREAVPAHHHAVLLTNDAGQLVVAATRCDDPRGAPRPSRTILNQALHQRVGVLVLDAADDHRIRVGHSISTQNIRSAVAVPMVSHGKLVGAVYAATQGITAAFERRHLDMLTLVAGPAAGNLESARLLDALGQTNRDLLRRLAMCARFNDDDTGYHIQRVGDYSAALARALGKTDSYPQLLRVAAPMHDIGKIGIPQSILQKPGKLTPQEFEVMKRHALIGEEILGGSPAPLVQLAAELAGSHHEKWDGSGYPRGLAGSAIPLSGRIVAVADVFDALTTERVYKPAFPLEKAYQILREGAGAHFDPQVVAAFFDILQEVLQIREHYAQIEALPRHVSARPS
ncbi:MAG: HD domain-containing protein [Myxococcales bacterium]|nr:HD domain-containing protein [Myxococcales bacterium]MCB9647515.1 HD domain-containing protein [Deltaproteobacteria bacterium]